MADGTDRSFQGRVFRRISALPPKAMGYILLAGAVIGASLYASLGPNDVWTGILVGGVIGGFVARMLTRILFVVVEAAHTRRLELAIVAAGFAGIGALIMLAR